MCTSISITGTFSNLKINKMYKIYQFVTDEKPKQNFKLVFMSQKNALETSVWLNLKINQKVLSFNTKVGYISQKIHQVYH